MLHGLTESQELRLLASVQYAAIRDCDDAPSTSRRDRWRDPNVLPKDNQLMRIETDLGVARRIWRLGEGGERPLVTGGSPLTWLTDRFAPEGMRQTQVARAASAYLTHLAESSSHRVENDLKERSELEVQNSLAGNPLVPARCAWIR